VTGALLEQGLSDGTRPGQAPPRTRSRRRSRRVLGVLAPLAVLALWSLVSARGLLSTRLLPAPATVADALRDFFLGDSTVTLTGVVPFAGAGFDHLASSLGRCAVSWSLAVLVGAVLGLLLGVSALARDLLDPVLNALRAVPLFAWLPLVLIWFGIGEQSARALIFIGALWPVLVAVGDSTARVPRAHIETARMLGTPRRDLWRRVYLPSALPEVVTGLRLSLTLAWTCVIVGELSGVTSGVGAMMNAARESGRTEQVVVGIVVFATVGLLADLVLRALTARWVSWASS
jgi:ABC-type nitrate/sulfonate/bicarbonate transport system permease component